MTSSQPQQRAPELEGYAFVRKLGRGGFGDVWLAEERSTKAMVAVKIIPKSRGLAGEELLNVVKVNETVREGVGEHLVRIFHIHEVEGEMPAFFIVMEYMEHGTIAELLQSRESKEIKRGIAVERACKLTASLLEGLQLLHENGLVHYDIKPGNIFLASKNRSTVKIGDYGLLKPPTSPIPNAGTASYKPPDCGGGVPDHRTDIYAAGAVLFELIFNRDPQDAAEWMYRDNRESSAPLPANVQSVIAKAMHVLPDRRYQTAREMLDAMRSLLAGNLTGTAGRKMKIIISVALLSLAAILLSIALFPLIWRENHSVVVITGQVGRETGTTVSRVRISDATVVWSRDLADSRRVLTIADGKGGYNVLVARAGERPMTTCLNGATGEELWTHEGELAPTPDRTYSDERRTLYANTIAHPNGPPNLCGAESADIILYVAEKKTTDILVVDSSTGAVGLRVALNFSARGAGWLPTVKGGGPDDYDIVVTSESGDLRRINGKTGAEVWRRNDLPHLHGIGIADVNGDGVDDFMVANRYYVNTMLLLSGADGATIWEKPFDGFDLVGDGQIIEGSGGGKEIIVGMQLSPAGAVRRYRCSDGSLIWSCDKAYGNNRIMGILHRKDGVTVLSLWRHQHRYMAFDAADGRMMWQGMPQLTTGLIGVPDMTGDGNDDLMVIMGDGYARLFDGLTGVETTGFTPIPATADVAYLPQ